MTSTALCLILTLVAAPSADQQPHAATDEKTLAALEEVLAGAPDDMRAANDYRMAVIAAATRERTLAKYDRALALFETLVSAHPTAANAHLNYGLAYVDKIPDAGSVTRVILATRALDRFTRSLELRPSWIAHYTRGQSYLFWPRVFGRTKHGIADLEAAMKIQKAEPKRSYHVSTYIALGDGHWILDAPAKASAIWTEGLQLFPDNPALKSRLAGDSEGVKAIIDDRYDSSNRVDTNLQDLWAR